MIAHEHPFLSLTLWCPGCETPSFQSDNGARGSDGDAFMGGSAWDFENWMTDYVATDGIHFPEFVQPQDGDGARDLRAPYLAEPKVLEQVNVCAQVRAALNIV